MEGVSKSVTFDVLYRVQSIHNQTVAGSGQLGRGRRRLPLDPASKLSGQSWNLAEEVVWVQDHWVQRNSYHVDGL